MPSTAMTRTRVTPWLGMGVSGKWDNVREALFMGELDYEVSQSHAYDKFGNELPSVLVNHNTTTGQIVGVTSDQYGVVQNEDAFSLLDPFCAAGGIIEHAGMTSNGMCFMVMHVPSMAFGFNGDEFELYVCAMNSFNTKFPLALIITPVRVYCQNMFRKLMARGDTALLIKHGRFAKERILSAGKASSLLLDYQHGFEMQLDVDYNLSADGSKLNKFVERMLPLVPVTPDRPRAKFSNERIEAQRREFIDDYYLASDNLKYAGTRLGILNAYYDWVTHHVPTRASAQFEDVRFSGLLNGTAVSRKLIASA